MTAAKHTLSYLAGSRRRGLRYDFGTAKLDSLDLKGYTDASYADDKLQRRSTSGYVITVAGTPVSWSTTLQKLIALSSCESEYYGATNLTKEVIWLQALLQELGYRGGDRLPLPCFSDNQGTIALAKNSVFHARTKHVGVQGHFVRHHVAAGTLTLDFLGTDRMPADGLTKALNKAKFLRFLALVNMENHGKP